MRGGSYLFRVISVGGASAQGAATPCSPVTFTSEQDHQNMMDQLGIKAVRPGFTEMNPTQSRQLRSGEGEFLFPDLPDPLTTKMERSHHVGDVVEAAPS